MDIQVISNWLLKTIPGIIFLGTLGSIVGSLIIRFVRWLWKKYGSPKILSFFHSYFVEHEITDSLLKKYVAEKEVSSIVILSVYESVTFLFASIMMLTLLSFTVFFFLLRGFQFNMFPIILISLNLLFVHAWIQTIVSFSGLVKRINDDKIELEKQYKKENS